MIAKNMLNAWWMEIRPQTSFLITLLKTGSDVFGDGQENRVILCSVIKYNFELSAVLS